MLSREIFNLCQQCFHNVFIKDDFLQLLSRMSSSFFKTISKLFQDQLQALLENQQSVQDNHQPSFSRQSSTFFFKTIFSLPFQGNLSPFYKNIFNLSKIIFRLLQCNLLKDNIARQYSASPSTSKTIFNLLHNNFPLLGMQPTIQYTYVCIECVHAWC